MAVFIWIFCLIMGGCTVFGCNDFDCGDSPMEDLQLLEYRPKEADLIRLCPKTLDYLNCNFKDAKACFGMEVEEIAEVSDGMARIIARFFLNAKNLADQVCDVNSTLRKNYLEHIECFESLLRDDLDAHTFCSDKSETLAKAFLMQKHNGNLIWSELNCLEQVYYVACFAEQIETTCGEVARQTFLTILEHFKHQVSKECHVEDEMSLKLSFLDYLNLEDNVLELYRSIFETYRKQ